MISDYPATLNISITEEDTREAFKRLMGTRVSLSENCAISVAAERIYKTRVASTPSEIAFLDKKDVYVVFYQISAGIDSVEYQNISSFTMAFDGLLPYLNGHCPGIGEMIDTVIQQFTFPLEAIYTLEEDYEPRS